MTSIMTNTAAMTALKTLQMTNDSLDDTQNCISTGYRVADAKDNAAYWSIATTMRSDNMAMSAVKDSLGIGSAMVDTAYTALNSTKDVLNEIKSKLTTATQDGVDKSKVQDEIGQLQEQLKSISSSASFSGQNWLSVDSSGSYNAVKDMVANFSRDASGALSLGSIKVDTSEVALYDANSSGKAILNGGAGGLADAVGVKSGSATVAAGGTAVTVSLATFPGTAPKFDQNDLMSFDLTFNGTTKTVVVDQATVNNAQTGVTDGSVADAAAWAKVLNAAIKSAGFDTTASTGQVDVKSDGTVFETIASKLGDTLEISNVAYSNDFVATMDISDSATTAAKVKLYIKTVDDALSKVTAGASTLGAIQNRVDMQTNFVSNLMDTIDKGVGTLVDADMTEEFDEAEGPPDPAAARRPGPLHRQLVLAVAAVALPLSRGRDSQNTSGSGRKAGPVFAFPKRPSRAATDRVNPLLTGVSRKLRPAWSARHFAFKLRTEVSMALAIGGKAQQLFTNLSALGPRKLGALGLVGLLVVALVGLGSYYLSRPDMETLYSGLDRTDVTRIGAALTEAGIPFDVDPKGDAILTPFSQTAPARMLLAEKGLPRSENAGYELFDNLGSIGLTSFMQEITRVRALEGELARTIQTLRNVRAARVHIVMPDEGSFRREQQKPSASVVIRTEHPARFRLGPGNPLARRLGDPVDDAGRGDHPQFRRHAARLRRRRRPRRRPPSSSASRRRRLQASRSRSGAPSRPISASATSRPASSRGSTPTASRSARRSSIPKAASSARPARSSENDQSARTPPARTRSASSRTSGAVDAPPAGSGPASTRRKRPSAARN